MNENYDRDSLLNRRTQNQRQAFSLIELLVVIAIIALLAALLFPAFSTAQESSRQSSTMSRLEQIQSALALYKLDNHAYPQVLFGYAGYNSSSQLVPMSDSYDIANTNSTNGVGSLFPTYISDFHVFESNDNPIDNNLTDTVALASLELNPSSSATYPTLTSYTRTFYCMDGFDVSPQIAALGVKNSFINGNTSANLKYVIRYERDWTSVQNLSSSDKLATTYTYGNPNGPYFPYYLNQLRWQNPPGNAYVTSTTYHVPAGNKILVLFQSGSVLKIDPTQLGGYNDSTSCSNKAGASVNTCTADANGDDPARFWQVENSQ